MMTKLLISLLGAGVIATAGYAAASSVDTEPARTVSLPGATNDDATTTTTGAITTDGAEDVSGPCDETEHRKDLRCAGAGAPAPAPAQAPAPNVTTADDDGPGDISGPCDEAEHRNDARCTGVAVTDDGEDRGADDRGNDDRGADDSSGHGTSGGDDDRSGSNSGKG